MRGANGKRSLVLAITLASTTMLTACAKKYIPPEIDYDDAAPAVRTSDPVAPVRVVETPKPLPLPGQLKPVDGGKELAR